jgi:hypothetical protein
MRTTKSFTIALVLATVLTAPAFAGREDGKRQRGDDQQQQTIVQRVIHKIVHIFDEPIVTQPFIPIGH